ncbi:MAG: 3-hydroxyisobutyrate dehydrogenase [Gammaproteobacteria bacterium]|nr:3-hydroxyisobutyrate dehydrogenase [Gammaproteobacteria bacterium]
MSRIGFVGIGNMGRPMALNLLAAGHQVTVFDLVTDACKPLAEAGAVVAGTLAEAVKGQEFVISMLPEGRHVQDAYIGQGGIIASLDAGTQVIDSSTIDVATAREVAAEARARGFDMLDAPVSGGTTGAEAASLTFMVGGSAEGFERARPILEAMGKRIVHCGEAGNGQAAKICNNMVTGIVMIAASEAFTLAERLGLDKQAFFDVISTSSGGSWVVNNMCPAAGTVPSAPSSNDYKPGFKTSLMAKDLRLAQAASNMTRTPTPLGATASNLYDMYLQTGAGELDCSSIIRMIAERG